MEESRWSTLIRMKWLDSLLVQWWSDNFMIVVNFLEYTPGMKDCLILLVSQFFDHDLVVFSSPLSGFSCVWLSFGLIFCGTNRGTRFMSSDLFDRAYCVQTFFNGLPCCVFLAGAQSAFMTSMRRFSFLDSRLAFRMRSYGNASNNNYYLWTASFFCILRADRRTKSRQRNPCMFWTEESREGQTPWR